MRGVLTLVALCVLANASHAQDKVQELVDKAIQARGGADKLNELKAWQTKTKGTLDIPQLGGATEFTGEGYVQLPDKNRISLVLQVMGQEFPVTVAFNGKEGWREVMGMVMDMQGPELKARMAAMHVDRLMLLTTLKDKQLTLALADEIMVNGKPAQGIKVSAKEQADVTLYFDKASHLLVKSATQMLNPMTGEMVQTETTMSNHKAIDGIQFPMKAVITRGGKTVQTLEVQDVKIVDGIDPKKFEKP